MGILKPKDASVRFALLTEGGTAILRAVARQASLSSWDWLISCGTEGHPTDDPHTRGDAYDFSVTTFPNSRSIIRSKESLEQYLGMAFTVLYETPTTPIFELTQIAIINPHATGPHFHVQVKRGTTYPPDRMLVT